ncbi:phosphorylase [Spirulina sp. CCNP1310]|uniref:ATP adenylyltransferase family protein n=1 Tax=Spirulina sp. CCNP1310 TaxID=3110249 RepID=UPI002B1FDF8B|nr:phosphorylase [Spirulina sp. CCNP1310]MEA5417660.1 phosphorylase [Spirulina sp. CCNP1310]
MEPLNLWDQIIARSEAALQIGALQPIPTTWDFIEQEGLGFLVRALANLVRKETQGAMKRSQQPNFNPFLPYEADLFVADLSPSHICLLNKFNVVDHHSLIVTRGFESQDDWLTLGDFAAVAAGLAEIDGLAFYNGGTAAGASQPHKHLQLVPLPLLPPGHDLPLDVAIAAISDPTAPNPIPHFPFRHSFAPLKPGATAAELWACYGQLLTQAGIDYQGTRQTAPYNWLMTRRWMVVIPRSQDEYAGISVNSLGFAGTLFVKNATQQQQLAQIGPLSLLTQVAIAR